MMRFPIVLALMGGLASLAGCAETDPYLKPGAWQPSGANSLNLAAMVANPRDLLRGRGARGSVGYEAAQPIARLEAGKTTPLPSSGSQNAPSGPAAAPPPVAGAPN